VVDWFRCDLENPPAKGKSMTTFRRALIRALPSVALIFECRAVRSSPEGGEEKEVSLAGGACLLSLAASERGHTGGEMEGRER